MASTLGQALGACASCDDPIDGLPLGVCLTCKEASPDATDGALCGLCFSQHERGVSIARGHRFSRTIDPRADAAAALLSRVGLSASPIRCVQHNKAICIACTTCQEHALCFLCLSKHSGHEFVVLSEAAPLVRALLRDAAAGSFPATTETPDAAPFKTACSSTQRISAERITAERVVLRSRKESAAQIIDAMCARLHAAIAARQSELTAELEATAAAADTYLAAELVVIEALSQQVAANAVDLAVAAEGLSDIDAVVYGDTLLARSAGIHAAIAALPGRPTTASFVRFLVGAEEEATLCATIAGLGRVVAQREEAQNDNRLSETAALAAEGGSGATQMSPPASTATYTRDATASRVSNSPVADATACISIAVTRVTELSQIRSSLMRLEAAVGDPIARQPLPRLRDFPVAACRDSGYTATQLKVAGFSATSLLEDGYDVCALRTAGFDAASLSAAGCDASALRRGGFSASEVGAAGFGLPILKAVGYDVAELRSSGYSARALNDVGFDAVALRLAGFDLQSLKEAGFDDARVLKVAGFNDTREFRAAGFDARALKAAGFSIRAVKGAGFGVHSLIGAGFDARELREVGYKWAVLAAAGFDVSALIAAGCETSALPRRAFDAGASREAQQPHDPASSLGLGLGHLGGCATTPLIDEAWFDQLSDDRGARTERSLLGLGSGSAPLSGVGVAEPPDDEAVLHELDAMSTNLALELVAMEGDAVGASGGGGGASAGDARLDGQGVSTGSAATTRKNRKARRKAVLAAATAETADVPVVKGTADAAELA